MRFALTNIVIITMKLVTLLAIVTATFIPSLLPGPKSKEMVDSEQLKGNLYENLLEELSGAHLRIAATHAPPAMIIEKNMDGTLRYSGYSADACFYLSEAFKFTYSFVNVVEDELKKGGPIEAEGNLLTRNEADMTSTDLQLIWKLFNLFDISVPFYTAGTAFMVPWPDEESRLLAPIYPFQATVWLILIVVLLAMTFVFTFFPWIHQKIIGDNIENNSPNTQQATTFSLNALSHQALAIMANITGHAGHWPIGKRLFDRILLASWCLASFVLVYAYSSLLISFLTIPILKPVAKSFDDVSFRNVQGLQPIAGKNTLSTNMIAVANLSAELNMWQKRALVFGKFFRQHPENLYTTPQQRFDLMYTGKCASSFNELLTYAFLSELNTKAGYCRFTVSAKHLEDLLDFHHVFLFRKNWRYTDAVRNKMQRWTDTGLAKQWIKNYQPSAKGCLFEDYKKNAPAIRVLTLKDLSGAFVVLLLGCALSLLVFLIEKIHFYRIMNRRPVVLII